MDAVDVRMLRHMGIQPFVEWPRDIDHLKPAYLARVLKIAPNTAKARVRRLERDGVISGYQVYPSWSQLGLYMASYLFRCPDAQRKATAMPNLAALENVVGTEDFLGNDVGMELMFRTPAELERRVKVISGLLGGATPIAYVPFVAIPATTPLSRLDWRIIRALRHRATRPLPEVAKELKVSARTVRRRVDRMWAEGSIDTVARLNVARVATHVFCNFLVRFQGERDPATAKRFFGAFETQWAYCFSPPDRRFANLVVGMVFPNAVEVANMARRMQGVPGVTSVEALVSVNYTTNEAWIDDAIDRKVEEATDPPAQPASPVAATR